jgi:hypothetical protein
MNLGARSQLGVIVAQKARKLRVAGAGENLAFPPLHVLRERAGVRVLSANQTMFAGKNAPHPNPPPATGGGDKRVRVPRMVIGQQWHEI